MAGPGIHTEGVDMDIGLCNEMRTVSQYDWWRSRNVRVVRQLELLFFPERWATLEDIDPGRWRGSCKLIVENFQDVELCTCNLLNCSCCVQRRGVVGLAPGEEFYDCHQQFGKWARMCR